MKKNIGLVGLFGAIFLAIAVVSIAADNGAIRTKLIPYEETPLTINSTARGEFKATIRNDGTAIDYELTFQNLSSTVTQSHIHFGRPGLTGGIVLFLCYNPAVVTAPAGVPVPQNCPLTSPATIKGTLTDVDVIAVPGQGIDGGAAGFAEMVKAIRAGAAYANVHSTLHPSGEIRGRLGFDRGDHRTNARNDERDEHDEHAH